MRDDKYILIFIRESIDEEIPCLTKLITWNCSEGAISLFPSTSSRLFSFKCVTGSKGLNIYLELCAVLFCWRDFLIWFEMWWFWDMFCLSIDGILSSVLHIDLNLFSGSLLYWDEGDDRGMALVAGFLFEAKVVARRDCSWASIAAVWYFKSFGLIGKRAEIMHKWVSQLHRAVYSNRIILSLTRHHFVCFIQGSYF